MHCRRSSRRWPLRACIRATASRTGSPSGGWCGFAPKVIVPASRKVGQCSASIGQFQPARSVTIGWASMRAGAPIAASSSLRNCAGRRRAPGGKDVRRHGRGGPPPMQADPVAVFLDAMEAAGIVRAEPIAHRLGAGELVRFRCDGDAPGQRSGAAWLWLEGWPDGGWWHCGLGISALWSLPQPKPVQPRKPRASKAGNRDADQSAQVKD